jgi:hypothetical protein
VTGTVAATVTPAQVLPRRETPCSARLDALEWAGVLAVRAGRWVVGVRLDSDQGLAAVDQQFATWRAPAHDHTVPANFSVRLGGEASNRPGNRPLHLVYRDHEIVARRRSQDELLLDLAELVAAVDDRTDEQVLLQTAAVVTPGSEVVLVPAHLHRTLLTQRRRLESAGLELLRVSRHALDCDAASVALHRPAVLAGRAVARTLDGRLPVRTWCLPTAGDRDVHLRPARAVYAAFPTVVNKDLVGAQEALRLLALLARHVPSVGLAPKSPKALVDVVAHLAG